MPVTFYNQQSINLPLCLGFYNNIKMTTPLRIQNRHFKWHINLFFRYLNNNNNCNILILTILNSVTMVQFGSITNRIKLKRTLLYFIQLNKNIDRLFIGTNRVNRIMFRDLTKNHLQVIFKDQKLLDSRHLFFLIKAFLRSRELMRHAGTLFRNNKP